MLFPRVLNIKVDGRPPGAKYCGRGSLYGNPFRVGVDGSRDEVCDRFECEVLSLLDVEPLRGFDLLCFCHPARCHVHSIYRKLYGREPPA